MNRSESISACYVSSTRKSAYLKKICCTYVNHMTRTYGASLRAMMQDITTNAWKRKPIGVVITTKADVITEKRKICRTYLKHMFDIWKMKMKMKMKM